MIWGLCLQNTTNKSEEWHASLYFTAVFTDKDDNMKYDNLKYSFKYTHNKIKSEQIVILLVIEIYSILLITT